MEYRNQRYTASGALVCEINHPMHGWIPFTASPTDPEELGREIYQQITDEESAAPYVADLVSVEDLKIAINAERDVRLSSLRVGMDGVTYDGDGTARENITSVVGAINAGVPVADPTNWRDANNVTQQLSHAKLIELSGVMLAAVQGIYETSWSLKQQIDDAPTLEAANAITWP